jgi:two-component system NarL family response regulator
MTQNARTSPTPEPTKLKTIRVIIADDHAVVRNGVATILAGEPDIDVIAEAPDGKAAIALHARHRPDVLLVDLKMPGVDGVTVIESVRREAPGAVIVILTTYDTDDDIERGLRAGARGYLLKDVSAQELVDCVRSVHAGKTCIAPVVASKLAERMSRTPLTQREFDVLALIADGRSNKEIAGRLFITEGTVKLHTSNLFHKLNVGSRTEAMKVAIERGLIRTG